MLLKLKFPKSNYIFLPSAFLWFLSKEILWKSQSWHKFLKFYLLFVGFENKSSCFNLKEQKLNCDGLQIDDNMAHNETFYNKSRYDKI